MNNSILRTIIFSFLLSIYLFNGLCIVISFNSPLFDYPGISILGIFSIILFTGIIILCTFYNKLFFFFLPFILLAFPNVINDFFPSFMMGPISESRVASFSFITHIDIFLIFGLTLFHEETLNKLENQFEIILTGIILMIGFFFLSTILFTKTMDQLSLFAIGTYQIRYILLFLLYLIQIEIRPSCVRLMVYGLAFSVFFLLIESIGFSHSSGRNTLVSGTLASNVFGNIIAAITLFFTFIRANSFNFNQTFFQPIRIITIIIGFIILILNGTRMAMLSLVIAGGFYYVKTSFNVKSIIQFIIRILGYGALFVIMITIAMQFDRFKGLFLILTDLINLNLKFSEDTASLFARLHLYQVSLNMIGEHWILGIGPGRWNFLKYDYGFSEIGTLLINVLLDPHNDYLSYFSQYGIFGLLFIGLILFFPTIQFLKNSDNPFVYFGLIPFTLIFSGMTNSNTLKHNIFALSSLIVLIVSQILLNNNSFNKIEKT